MKKLIFIFILTSTLAYSQQEASVWYFGQNAGLKFQTDGTVTPLADGQINTAEGCSSIADANGNLLLYTDGRTVWDRNHVQMPNGSFYNGTELFGDGSSTQSGIIVPKPGDPNQYYIFTVDEPHHENAAVYPNAFSGNYIDSDSGQTPDNDDGRNNGLNYSIVDLTLTGSNGSIGDVTSRNNHLITYDPDPLGEEVKYKCSEKITAIKNEADNSYWIITHFINKFYAFKVTASGVISTPIISAVGSNQTLLGYRKNAIGYLKASPDGTKLAIANQQNGTVVGTPAYTSGNAELFDFDRTTGVVSNAISLIQNVMCYGVEFSPNSEKLYATYRNGVTSYMELVQFDLTSSNIPVSKVVINNQSTYMFELQLAPNNKIYCATAYLSTLGVIDSPDSSGLACNYAPTGQSLAGKIVKLGLPPFITSYFNATFTAENFCLGSNTQFTLSASQNVTNVSWDFGDSTPISNVINPTHIYTAAGSYQVTATITGATGTITRSKSVTISATPVLAATIANQSVCGAANMSYNLSQFNSTLLGSQSTTVFGVIYFDSQINAVNHTNVLPSNYSLPLGTTTFFAKVYNLSNSNCCVVTSFTVTLSLQPTATVPSDFIICENLPYDNLEVFDLSTKNSQVLNGQSSSSFTVSYHASQSDADLNNAPLPALYTNTLPQETIYVRVQNSGTPNCYATTTLHLSVVHQPQIAPVSDFLACDDISNDGIASFSLDQKNIEILNGQSPTVFEVKYYFTLADAQNNVNGITAPINNTSNNQTIYYSISAVGNIGCKAVSGFKLIVSRIPVANSPNALFICDDVTNNGIGQFDLNTNTPQILGTQSVAQFTVTYHLNQNDADTGLNDLPLNYQNISNPQTIFARMENNQNHSCFVTTSFQIGLNQMPAAFQPQALIECDDDGNDGKALFDLSQQTAIVLGSQSPSVFTVSYHASLSDANSGNNDLSLNFTNTSNPQTIYARIENNTNPGCFATISFQLKVRAAPILTMDDVYSNCEGSVVTITAPLGFSSYNWSNGATTSSTSIATAGNYSLTVTSDYGTLSCSTTKNFTVYNSNRATITSIETRDWTDNQNMIIVHLSSDGKGDYEYSLDGIHYQDSNIFEGLPSGQYTVYVNDKKECGEVTEEVFLLMYPKFFTPNGDGINDVWRIKFSNTEPDMELQIFDRYGKLITVFKGLDFGWDGTFNGKAEFSDDYWFVVKRENGKEFRGHFSLKR